MKSNANELPEGNLTRHLKKTSRELLTQVILLMIAENSGVLITELMSRLDTGEVRSQVLVK